MKIGIPIQEKTDMMPSCPILGIKENPNAMIGITRVGGTIILDLFEDTDMQQRIINKVMTYRVDYAFPEEISRKNEIIEGLYNELVKRLSDVSDQLTSESLEGDENLRKLARMIYFTINGKD